MVGEETEWTEYAGLCVGDEIMVDLIMDPQYKISSRSLSDVVIMSFTFIVRDSLPFGVQTVLRRTRGN